jgi:hypothetical protein
MTDPLSTCSTAQATDGSLDRAMARDALAAPYSVASSVTPRSSNSEQPLVFSPSGSHGRRTSPASGEANGELGIGNAERGLRFSIHHSQFTIVHPHPLLPYRRKSNSGGSTNALERWGVSSVQRCSFSFMPAADNRRP